MLVEGIFLLDMRFILYPLLKRELEDLSSYVKISFCYFLFVSILVIAAS